MKEKKDQKSETHMWPQLSKPFIKMKNIDKFGGDYLLCRSVFAKPKKVLWNFKYQAPLPNST